MDLNQYLFNSYFFFLVTQANGNEVELMLMNVIIEQMICDTDPDLGRAVQLMGVIRVLIDPENMLPSLSKVEKTDFLNYFYKHSVQILIGIYCPQIILKLFFYFLLFFFLFF